jgi:branched-chain amino acid transport system substrate-binding protein
MSKQTNDSLALVLSLLITAGMVAGGGWWLLNRSGLRLGGAGNTGSVGNTNSPTAVRDRISQGDKVLFSVNNTAAKQQASQAIAQQNYAVATSQWQTVLNANRNDPEALIGLNNAKIAGANHYTIAASLPISSDPNGALEILRGVAQAQTEINQAGGVGGVPLQVAIANDDNQPEVAQQVANALADDASVLGVVGPYASDVSIATAPVYQQRQLVAISPISTATKLSSFSPYFFRTVPSDYVAARALANYMTANLKRQKAAVFFNSKSGYSQSLRSEFQAALSLGGGQTVAEVDLSDPGFSAAQSVETAIGQGAQVLMLAANTSTVDAALQVVQVNRQRLALLAGDDVYTLKTLEVGNAAAETMVLAIPWHIAAPTSANFARSSRNLWGADVNWRTAMAYDATQAIARAAQANPNRASIQQALRNGLETPGASRPVRFLPSGDRDAPVQLVQVRRSDRSTRGYDFVPLN